MLFTSWEFICLLVVTFICYYAPLSKKPYGKSWQVNIALVASVIFYGWEDPKLIALLGITCLGNSIATGRIIHNKVSGSEHLVKKWTRGAVIMNLGILAIFKYLPFLIEIIPFIPISWVSALKTIPLPIGISFYTFHGISMIVDVARGEVANKETLLLSKEPDHQIFRQRLRDIGFYLLFFPQLIAGPIVKAKQFWPQITSKKIEDISWKLVIRALITGYFLKVFVADNLSEQTAFLTHGSASLALNNPINLITLLYCYSFQIFADFAGYSLIAVGLAGIFGYKFPENFNFPYLSTSLTEFWRRWHMSLSAWLRDYLYIPLGGNKKGAGRTYINLFLVMFLGGLWHGAEWKFAIWGSLHGLFLAVERFTSLNILGRSKKNVYSQLIISDKNKYLAFKTPVFAILKWILTFHIVTILWLTFLMPDLDSIVAFFKGVCNGSTRFSGPPIFCISFYGVIIVIYHMWGWLKEYCTELSTRIGNSSIEPIVHAVMIFLTLTNSGAPSGFIYFQF